MKSTVRQLVQSVMFCFAVTLIAISPASAVVIDFEDLQSGSVFCTTCGNVPYFAPRNIIFTAGRRMELSRFNPFTKDDNSNSGAIAVVRNDASNQLWDPRGNFLSVSDGVLDFDIQESTQRLAFDIFIDNDGKSEFLVDINGETSRVSDLLSLHGHSVGGVTISLVLSDINSGAIGWHTLVFEGLLDSFAFGGDRFSIDNIRYQDGHGAEVPEPRSLLLLGSGIIGLYRKGQGRSRRSSAVQRIQMQ